MKEKIDEFIEYLSTITKEQAEFMAEILNWSVEKKIAFTLAKRIFDEDNKINE